MATVTVGGGKLVLKSPTGDLREVPASGAQREANETGSSFASLDEIHQWNRREKFGPGVEVAKGLGTAALSAATGGILSPSQGSPAAERQEVVGEEHPYAMGATEMAATALPAMAGGELVEGAGLLSGAGKTVAGAARGGLEGAIAGLAQEGATTSQTGEPISAGNIAIAGLGGALLGAVIPHVLSRAGDMLSPKALPATPAEALAEGGGSIIPDLERQSAEHAAAAVDHMPEGEARTATEERTAPIRRERAASDLADVQATADAQLAKTELNRADLKRLIAKDSPAQTDWATNLATDLRAAAEEIESTQTPISGEQPVAESGPRETLRSEPPAPATPEAAPAPVPVTTDGKSVSLVGNSLEDLGGSGKLTKGARKYLHEAQEVADTGLVGKSLEDLSALEGVNRDTVEGLKGDETFRTTGNVKDNFGSSEQGQPNFIIDTDGKLKLTNGRHRLTAAQEMGRETIEGRIRKFGPRGGETWVYQGPIRVLPIAEKAAGKAAGEAAAETAVRRAPSGARIADIAEGKAPDFGGWDLGDFEAGKGRSSVHKNQGQYGGTSKVSQYQRSIVDGLKENAEFARTGRVSGDAGKLGSEPTFEVTKDGTVKLHHGKMRIIAARELERDTIYGRVMRGKEVVYEGPVKVGAGKAPEPAASAPAPKAPNSDAIDIALRQGRAEQLSPHAGSVDALRNAGDSLLESKGGLDTLQRARQALADLRRAGAPPEVIARLEKGVADESLWGRAGEAVGDYDRSLAHGAGDAPEALAQRLEDRAAARAKWQAAGEKDRSTRRLLEDARRVRAANDVSKPPAEASAEPATGLGGKAVAAAKHAAGGHVGHMAIGALLGHGHPAGMAMMAGKAVWSAIGENGRAVIAATARRVARGSLEAAAFGAPAVTGDALAKFAEGYSGPREAYAARVQTLTQMQQNPGALPHALAQSLGDLPEHDPQLYGDIAARMQRAITYVSQNLPPGVATSLANPRGVPTSADSLREFAIVWNSAMHPVTVLHSVAAGTASAAQIRTLQAVDPDTYAQLLSAITAEVGQNFQAMSSQRKQHLDIIFASDGIAGPAYSWRAAEHIQESMQQSQAARGKAPASSTPMATKKGQASAPNARGLDAIAGGVTNRAA